jgi:diketogulonate reductase-like aldo/keto reductase
MISSTDKKLSNRVKIPTIGFGTYLINNPSTATNILLDAIKQGYRHIDTASFYGNEKNIGEAIQRSRIPREDFFLVSKVWNNEQGYENTLRACERSCRQLGTDYLDLYLIHWPQKDFISTWKAMEQLYREKKVRAIGVSNFTIEHLEMLQQEARVYPMVNQVELHPLMSQPELVYYCRKNKIQLIAWSPLMRGKINDIPELIELSKKHQKSVSQIVLRWEVQLGVVSIPKTTSPVHMKQNLDVFDFELDQEDMTIISALNEDERRGIDPNDVYLGKVVLD